MRLLHLPTFQLREFFTNPPAYAIASHRWSNEEVTFQDLLALSSACEIVGGSWPNGMINFGDLSRHRDGLIQRTGFKKIWAFREAIKQLVSTLCPQLKVEYLWIDTCCIDKTNSVELQEALNSMFKWYAGAEVCLAYLYDVVSLDQHPNIVMDSFITSAWFKRGWTLQELLAPKSIIFYNGSWEILGIKRSATPPHWTTARVAGLLDLNLDISLATGISQNVLWDFSRHVKECSVSERRSWMRGRFTTRLEDRVYCQLGIFGVFMPLIYGEGDHALVRLEEAIEQNQRRSGTQAGKKGIHTAVESRTFQISYFAKSSKNHLEIAIPGDKKCIDLTKLVLHRLLERDESYPRSGWGLQYGELSEKGLGSGTWITPHREITTIHDTSLCVVMWSSSGPKQQPSTS